MLSDLCIIDSALFIQWHKDDSASDSFSQLLPWHNVGVMFSNRQQYRIATSQIRIAQVRATVLIAAVVPQ